MVRFEPVRCTAEVRSHRHILSVRLGPDPYTAAAYPQTNEVTRPFCLVLMPFPCFESCVLVVKRVEKSFEGPTTHKLVARVGLRTLNFTLASASLLVLKTQSTATLARVISKSQHVGNFGERQGKKLLGLFYIVLVTAMGNKE